MPSKRIKNRDGKLVDVLLDQPGSISNYDRLLNARAPVGVEQDGITKGQSDILNFILPGGSTIVPAGSKIDITIPSVQNIFIFRPSGVAAENIYTDFVALMTAHDAVDGPKVIHFDGPSVIPVGSYNFSNTLLTRFKNPEYSVFGGSSEIVTLSVGTVFLGGRLFVQGLTLRSLNTSPVIVISAEEWLVVLQEGAELEAASTSEFIGSTYSGAVSRMIMDKSRLLTGTDSVIKQDVGSIEFDIYKFGGSAIEDDTLETVGAGDLIKVFVYDTGVECSETHSGLFSPATLEIELKTDSSFEKFDPTVIGTLISENVQDAIDELTGLIVGGGVIPKKDKFTPAFLGETGFVLSFTPAIVSTFLLAVNGQEQEEGVSYTVVGTALTWLDVPFILETTDLIKIYYYV